MLIDPVADWRQIEYMHVHRRFVVCLALLPCAASAQPTVENCNVFPANNIWNMPVDQLSVAPNSATLVSTIGSIVTLHSDFGSGTWTATYRYSLHYGLGAQTKYPTTFQYADESDSGPYAMPLNAPIEGGSASTGNRHTIAIDTDNCIRYRAISAYPQSAGWQAGSGVIFNLNSKP